MAKDLAGKYRPPHFTEVVGQDNIKAVLTNQLETGEFKQAYLFTGGAGTGKTTCARIFANDVNGGKGRPIEIDGASNNGVDNVRVIIDNCKFKSMDSTYKVYIIDEVHMLSIGAFNALLKTLEEPPANTIFILCTTDPQKIPATIISRVQRFDFKRLSTTQIIERLRFIVNVEDAELSDRSHGEAEIYVSDEALEYIAKIADGGMRNAITLLDTCLGYGHSLTIAEVINILGSTDYQVYFEFIESIIDNSAVNAITIVEELHADGKDLKQFIKGVNNFILDVMKYALLGDMNYLAIPNTYLANLDSIINKAPLTFYQEVLKTFIELNGRIRWESNVKPVLQAEVMLLCL